MSEPVISPELQSQLLAVEPSFDGTCLYRPTRVTVRSGEIVDRVYLVEAESFRRVWGPEQDEENEFVSLDDVVRIEESPVRLPPALANKLYEAGESGMGYVIFTVLLVDARRLPFVVGNMVDFPALPDGVGSGDVVDVLPHVDDGWFRDRAPGPDDSGADYSWCLYRLPD